MQCRNCLNELPEGATACMYCEAKGAPEIPPERAEAIRKFQADDFVAAMMVGQ